MVAAGSGFDGDRLGRYQVERLLGRGAAGMVLLARDDDNGHRVAIKALSTEGLAPEALREVRERFYREAEVARRLQHPDIVGIREAGEDRGWAYLVMEYVAAQDLQRHILPGQLLPVPAVVQIGGRVARALAHAHRQGVVHRDIKPANVLVDGAAGMVKVTDFGIAHLADACRTRTGMVLGTPAYMAPEQLTGQRVDARTDLYALGVTLFQLLTGALPYQADSAAKLLYSIVNEAALDAQVVRPDVPQALAQVLQQTLAKAPSDRYQDGVQLAEALEAAVGSGHAASASAAADPAGP